LGPEISEKPDIDWSLVRVETKRKMWKSIGQNWGYLVLALVLYG
jgi:hypothetical protein